MAELQLSRWQQAAQLSHPHLIPIHDTGRFDLDGAVFVYAVMECAEENLAQVLPGRALTPAEAREMLDSVLDVLAYLHRKGFVHGHINPANIMASGDELKVSSDALSRAGESLEGPGHQTPYDPPEYAQGISPVFRTMSAAGDVWSLGMTLVETLTQNLPVVRTAEQQDPQFPQTLQEPFLDIARHCLLRQPQSRWTVAQIATRLEGRAQKSQVRSIAPEVRTALPEPQPIARPSRPAREAPQLRCAYCRRMRAGTSCNSGRAEAFAPPCRCSAGSRRHGRTAGRSTCAETIGVLAEGTFN